MDRRSFLLGLAGVLGTTALMAASGAAEALPLQPPPERPPEPKPEPAVATEADLDAVKAEEAQWVIYRRPRRWRRRYYYWRPRRRYGRRYYWRPRRRRRWVCVSRRTGRVLYYGRCR